VFTGIVKEVGRVESAARTGDGLRLTIATPEIAGSVALGDSVAIDGVCLTAVAIDDGTLSFDAVPETVARSSLADLAAGDAVNVEPALRAGDPLGGHMVQGHIDGVASVRSVADEGEGRRVWVDAPIELLAYCVEKGSVAVDGVSLTIAALDDSGFAVALVPHTLEATTFGQLAVGDRVNVEVDILAKYVERVVTMKR
jgi:riboflavin synthase alpha subunit